MEFGAGSFEKLPGLLARYGRRVLIVSGAGAFRAMPQADWLHDSLEQQGFVRKEFQVSGEPSPQLVDQAVESFRGANIEVVLGVGGGSVLDAAKAIAGLLRGGNTVMDYLEGVGPELPYQGPAVPYIAVPTTAGTGAEATKNAVLSVRGKNGFKKSFRDERLVPEYAVIDPDLLASCPPGLIAANGMDAFTQLLESFVSTRANPFTDALATSGLEAVRDGLLAWHQGGADAAAGRGKMAYAALLSGITLAQTGLGSVHGLAAPLGAYYPIPHGAACGILVAAATRVNIEALAQRGPAHPALGKYAEIGRLLGGNAAVDDAGARTVLLGVISDWAQRLKLPGLGAYGVTPVDFPLIVANCRGSSMKTNPVELSDEEVSSILQASL